jgi:hypothetical protein
MRSNRKLDCVHGDCAGLSVQIGECYPLHGRTARQVAHITPKRRRFALNTRVRQRSRAKRTFFECVMRDFPKFESAMLILTRRVLHSQPVDFIEEGELAASSCSVGQCRQKRSPLVRPRRRYLS